MTADAKPLRPRVPGQGSGRRKLDAEQVAEIRALIVPRDPLFGTAAYARRFGVDRTTINNATRRVTWKELP